MLARPNTRPAPGLSPVICPLSNDICTWPATWASASPLGARPIQVEFHLPDLGLNDLGVAQILQRVLHIAADERALDVA